MDDVCSVTLDAVNRAREVVLGTPGLSARDAVHVAVMEQHGVNQIFSFDRGFDQVPGVTRIGARTNRSNAVSRDAAPVECRGTFTTDLEGEDELAALAGATLRLVERFTRVEPDTIDHRYTVEDPAT